MLFLTDERFMIFLELFGHLSFAMVALSFWLKDVLSLRVTSMIASSCAIIFQLTALPEPLMMIVWWNLLFIAINGTRVFIMVQDRLKVNFTEEETELFYTNFRSFTPVEYMKLLRAGQWINIPAGDLLISEGEEHARVCVIYNGRAAIRKHGRKIARISDGSFLGEMSFFDKKPASADVVAESDLKMVAWRREDLDQLLKRNPTMTHSLHAVFTEDLAAKLRRQSA